MVERRACAWCRGGIRETSRVDARYCSKRCRQAGHRASIRRVELEATDRPLRLAYADPPYPGNAARFYGDHPDFAGEVDHAELLSRLATYDGWALSTSAAAVPAIAALCVAQDLGVRIAIWVRPPRPHATARILTGYEAVFVRPARRVVADIDRRVVADVDRPVAPVDERPVAPVDERPVDQTRSERVARIPLLRVTDVLVGVDARPRPTLPSAVVGMKPPAFCEWIFRLLGALPGDTLDDLYPGSGLVGRSWRLYTSGSAGVDASPAATSDASRIATVAG